MTTVDWILVLAIIGSLTFLALALTSKRTTADPAPPPANTPSEAPRAASEPPAGSEKPPAPTKPPAELPSVGYEDDEEIDPTRVGQVSLAPKRVILQPPIVRIVHDDDAEVDEPTHAESFFLVSATAQTDTGLRRKRNEDALLVLPGKNLFVVADGMGGHAGGEMASALAVKTVNDAYESGSFEGEPHLNLPREATELARALQMANAAVLEKASITRELQGMGTTICAARFSPNKERLYLGHVGDSRCYRFRDGMLSQLTADHTMADLGVEGPQAQQLSRAVGIWPTVPIDIIMVAPMPGDVYLLCSDGLTKMLRDQAIEALLSDERDPKAAVEKLIVSANEKGGKDHITVILVRVVAPTEADLVANPPPAAAEPAAG